MRTGIMVAGSILVDKINQINSFPRPGELTQIKTIDVAVGGAVPNDTIDMKIISPNLDIYAAGKIGDDEEGKFVLDSFKKYGIDTSNIIISNKDKTSFTNVMSVIGGERTFFTYAGTSADFGYDDLEFNRINVKMLHLGYFLLLDKIDHGDGLKILKKAKEQGIITSIDLVSENSDRYSLIIPCLKYVDNLIINEIEASKLAGIELKEENLKLICEKLKELGVRDRVIIHMPKMGICLSSRGYVCVPSVDIDKSLIKGKTGAGDAFCSGALIGIYNGYDDYEILDFASSCAAVSLRTLDATSGLMSEDMIVDYCKNLDRIKI